MWLHALESVHEEASAGEIKLASLGQDAAFDLAPGPERVSHRAPRVGGVGTEVACAILANDETGGGLGELQGHNALLVGRGLDGVRGAIGGELDGAVVGVEAVLGLVEAVVAQRVRRPQVRRLTAVLVKDLAVKLARGADASGKQGH